MLFMKKVFLFLILVQLLCSCSQEQGRLNEESQAVAKPLTFQKIREWKIPVEGLPYHYTSACITGEHPDSVRFWLFNNQQNNIIAFDDEGNIERNLRIPKEGPNSIPFAFDFLPINSDSILFTANHLHKIYLYREEDNEITSLSTALELPNQVAPENYYLYSFPETNVRPHYLKGKLFMQVHHNVFKNPFGPEKYRLPFLAVLNVHTMQYDALFGGYPENYLSDDKFTFSVDFPFTLYKNRYVYVSFPRSHEVHKYDLEGQLIKKAQMRGATMPNEFELLAIDAPKEAKAQLFRNKGFYASIISDPYRNLLYRVVLHPQPEKDIEGLINTRYHATWSILVFNEELKVLGECSFPALSYNYTQIFVHPSGLLISKENSYNKTNKEDLLEFDLIKINVEDI